MELLNQGYTRLVASIKAMTPAARAAATVAAIAVVVSLAYVLNQQASSKDSYLLGGEEFSTSQLREIQIALGKANLEVQVDGARLKVPRGQESKYMAALAESGAIPDFGGYLKKAVGASGFMLYGPQQEARTKVAIQSELQLVISRMKGIENAFVHIDQEIKRGFREKNIVTASVGVQPRGNHSLDETTVAAIRSFVASAWAGLKPEAVTVVDLSGPRLFAGTGGDVEQSAAVGNYADHKKRLESDWQEKISRLLAQIVPGALVTTNVELGAEVSSEEKSPKRVSVSVAIPHTHYEQMWRKHASREDRPDSAALAQIEAAEKKKIEAAILPLLGSNDPSADSRSQVAVTTFYPVASTPSSDPALRAEAVEWLARNWSSVCLACLAVVGMIMLRSIVKSTPTAKAPLSEEHGTGPAGKQEMHVPDRQMPGRESSERPRQRAATGPMLRDELADIVREHPDSAVSLLRTWIGNAGH